MSYILNKHYLKKLISMLFLKKILDTFFAHKDQLHLL